MPEESEDESDAGRGSDGGYGSEGGEVVDVEDMGAPGRVRARVRGW